MTIPLAAISTHNRGCKPFPLMFRHKREAIHRIFAKGNIMRTCRAARPYVLALAAVALALVPVPSARAACCYFSAKNADILQPAQKVFITWDPEAKLETFTVQPKFEGNALDFGMVIPTPAQPKLHEIPRDFFKELAVLTILKKRQYPESKLLPR